MNIRKSILLRVRLAFLLVIVISGIVSWKVLEIQSNSKWKSESLQNRVKPMTVKAGRGNIYAADGSILATSIPEYEFRWDSKVLRKKTYDQYIKGFCDSLSKMFPEEGMSSARYKIYMDDARDNNKRYLKLVKRKLKYHEVEQIKKWAIYKIPNSLHGGIIFPKTENRVQPFVHLARKTIGDVNMEKKKGEHGIETSFQKYLSGTDGLKYYERESDGSWRPLGEEESKKTEHGLDVHTTLDINLQDVSETELMKALKKNNAQYGCAILMEVETGEIKAMANLKRTISRGDTVYKENFNYALARRVNPGSTIKLASVMAILEHSNFDLNDTIDTGNGVHEFYGVKLRDSHRGGYGKITLQEVFEKSSNIGVAKLTDTIFNKSLIDQEIFLKYLKDFGLARDLGFQIYGTMPPKIPDPNNNWSGITIPWLSIGYEAEMTPLQILSFYNGVANNGKMIQPIIVNQIKKSGQIIKEFKPKVLQENLCSRETLKKVKTMLEGVVERGTAENIKTDKYKIAGKTGTTQKFKNGRYVKEYYTSFVGYFPADKPKYSCIVVVDNPQTDIYGNTAAAPVFKAIADYVYANDISNQPFTKLEQQLDSGLFPVIRVGHHNTLLL